MCNSNKYLYCIFGVKYSLFFLISIDPYNRFVLIGALKKSLHALSSCLSMYILGKINRKDSEENIYIKPDGIKYNLSLSTTNYT